MSTRTVGDMAAQLATPGSYGEGPRGERAPEGLALGPVTLQVSDLARSAAFYISVLGLMELQRDETQLTLGAADLAPLVVLRERGGARAVPSGGRLGLYHFALLLPGRDALGRFLAHLVARGVRPGMSDHLVSEALYLQDPDGLGIEVYADRPRDQWRRDGRELLLATEPLAVREVLAAGGDAPWSGMPAGTVMGHVHLHVGDLEAARAFYGDGLGLDVMTWRYPGALFLGAGGYHHHLGTNTWARGAIAPAVDEAQLLEWQMVLPTPHDVAARRALLVDQGVLGTGAADSEDGFTVADPWGTRARLRAR